VNSIVADEFVECFLRLPTTVQAHARRAYRLWTADPRHPSLHFKRVGRTEPVFSVRVGIAWRALGLLEGDTITWFWIGSHAEYDQMLG
jgi:hypothetical protein